MSDIVERLNEHAEQAHESGSLGWRDTMNEAADTITALRADIAFQTEARSADGRDHMAKITGMAEKNTRLTAEVERLTARLETSERVDKLFDETMASLTAEAERLRAALIDNAASLEAAISLLERGGKKAAPSDKMFEMMLNDYRKSTNNARAALTSAPAPSPWRPIETAPTDGTVVRVFAAERQGLPAFQCTAAYHEDAGWCVDELREVTHWMPLHPAPQKEVE